MPPRRPRRSPPTPAAQKTAAPPRTGALDPWFASPQRRILVVVVGKNVEMAMWSRGPGRMPVLDTVATIIALHNESAGRGQALPHSTPYDLYSWDLNQLPDHLKFYEVPRPGIVLAVSSELQKDDTASAAFGAKYELERIAIHKFSDRVKKFMASPDVNVEGVPVARHDVFLSYSTKDKDIASGLLGDLQHAGLTCFTAEQGLHAGVVWTQSLRDAIGSSRIGLLLLTPHSMQSSWVMCEVGALWALGKPIVPALIGATIADAPDILTAFQAKPIESESQRQTFIRDLARLCGVNLPAPAPETRVVPGVAAAESVELAKKATAPGAVTLRPHSFDGRTMWKRPRPKKPTD